MFSFENQYFSKMSIFGIVWKWKICAEPFKVKYRLELVRLSSYSYLEHIFENFPIVSRENDNDIFRYLGDTLKESCINFSFPGDVKNEPFSTFFFNAFFISRLYTSELTLT